MQLFWGNSIPRTLPLFKTFLGVTRGVWCLLCPAIRIRRLPSGLLSAESPEGPWPSEVTGAKHKDGRVSTVIGLSYGRCELAGGAVLPFQRAR